MELWNIDTERKFFSLTMREKEIEEIFYKSNDFRFFAYWPKGYKGKKDTIQSRNTIIGDFTEMWTQELLQPIANELNLYAVQGAVCEELALPKSSAADVAISSTKLVQQRPEDIKAIIEVKMSIVWNWEYKNNGLFCLGDYTTHSGNPGLLRSDSMLKAIGKSVNIRISSNKAHRIPIVVLGNTPITKSYYEKVDHLKKTGIIQGFWSVNPKPRTDNKEDKKTTPSFGFRRFDDYQELREQFHNLITNRFSYFSGMKNELELGKIIERANRETTYEKKAELFLRLLQESN